MKSNPLTLVPSNAIIGALTNSLPLSTNMLVVKAGIQAGMSEKDYLSTTWRNRVYRNAVRMERANGVPTSKLVYNGHSRVNERVWRLSNNEVICTHP
jgi:hypothetical protein